MPALQPNARSAKLAIIALWTVLLLDIVSFAVDLFFLLTNQIPNEKIENQIIRLSSLAGLFSMISFLLWFSRAYSNLRQFTGELKYADGWAIGAWFVPILNLFRPYQIMKELHSRTGEVLEANGIAETKLKTSPVKTWWYLWLASWGLILIFLLILSFWMFADILIYVDNGNISEGKLDNSLQNFDLFTLCGNVFFTALTIYSAYITIKVVKNYSEVEPLLSNCYDLKTLREERTASLTPAASEPPPLN